MKFLSLRRFVATCGLMFGLVGTAQAQTFQPASAGDFGNSHSSYPASRAIDGNTAFSSRWAARFNGEAVSLFVDLGSVKRIDDVGIAWGRGNARSFEFEIRARRGTSGKWAKVFRGRSSGSTSGIERYNVDDMDARQVRIKVTSNSANTNWADVTEFEVYGTGGPNGGNSGDDSSNDDSSNDDSGTTFSIPGLIQAEDFNNYSDADSRNNGGQYRSTGVDIQSTSDAGGGFNIGWIRAGEWLEYDINVQTSGDYEAQVRVASTRTTGRFSFDIDGRQVSSVASVASTGNWQSWRTQSLNLGNLNSGRHTLRINMDGNSFNLNWMNIVRTGGNDGGNETPANPVTNFGLDPNRDPWENFDLSRWSLDTPAPRDNDNCRAERTWDHNWDDSNPLDSSSRPFFFTHSDGGLRFVTRIDGETTSSSCNSGFVRSELREMIRAGNQNIDDTGVSRNNWKLGYQPGNDSNWGGVNGEMNATLRVNEVTTSGDSGQVGRVIVGQIHAINDEPLRLYYRKRGNNRRGCIYFGHEIRNSDDEWFEMIGDRDCLSSPSDGIELNELFSYTIINDDEDISVIIRRGDRDGPIIARRTIDMNNLNSGYDRSDESMYFKAGAYTQNNSGNGSDGDVVTFYRLSVSHD